MQQRLKTITLHGHISSPNVLKCAITMEYLDVPYEVKIWDIVFDRTKGRNLDNSLDKLSPNGRVPVINDPNTGVELWESGAIVNYLKRQYDHTAMLGPKGDSEQSIKDLAELDKWEMLLLTTIGPMTGQLVWFSMYHHVPNEDAIDRYLKQVYRYYDVVEEQLKTTGGKSICPWGFSSADIQYQPWLSRPTYINVSLDGYPNIRKWVELMGKEQQIQNAYQRIKEASEKAGH
ncbi:Glutathione S-transferase, domain-containing protein [Cladophialophora immunda]|nr:Glutathione S-transferase, domain-containing protein [Cladophialophora immunda]